MAGAAKFLTLLPTPLPRLHHCPSLLRSSFRSRLPQTLTYLRHHVTFSISPGFPGLRYKASRRCLCTQSSSTDDRFGDPNGLSHAQRAPQTCPEWSRLLEVLSSRGYFDQNRFPVMLEDEFISVEDFPDDFLRTAHACLALAIDRPNLLGFLSRKDIEVVIQNGTPFMFKKSIDSIRRMRSFLGVGERLVTERETAQTIDLMRFLLSYMGNPNILLDSSIESGRQLAESSVSNLLNELAQVIHNAPEPGQFSGPYVQRSRNFAKDIEMKRGDWICPKCGFMNFARNMVCLECRQSPRPPRQLVEGEWECPQCDFHNYSRNKVCLRCECRRPGEVSFRPKPSSSDVNPTHPNRVDVGSTSSPDPSPADDDFPDIMPARKGVNRYVLSTRKTPLERRVADPEHQGISTPDGTVNKQLDPMIMRELDEILGQTGSPQSAGGTDNAPQNLQERNLNESTNLDQDSSDVQGGNVGRGPDGSGGWGVRSLEGSGVKEREPLDMSEEAKTERWFKRVAQIKDISELSQIPDEDFPSIMPMRKGVNRFVVSKRKTPLERRMESAALQQHRRDFPGVCSDPLKREDE